MVDEQLYGHDGRGHFKGVSLVEVPQNKTLEFTDLLTVESPLDPSKLDESRSYGLGFIKLESRENALTHLGITDDMLAPGIEGPEGPQGAQGIQGPKGDKGDQGDKGNPGSDAVFNVDSLSQSDLSKLYKKLRPFYPQRYWLTKNVFVRPTSNTVGQSIRIADTNLKITYYPTSVDYFRAELSRYDASLPSTYDFKRAGFYDSGVEGVQWNNYQFTSTPVNLDSVIYNESREFTFYSIYERETSTWWIVNVSILGSLRSSDNGGAIIVTNTTKINNEVEFGA